MDAYPWSDSCQCIPYGIDHVSLILCVDDRVVLVIQSTYRILLDERKPFMQTLNGLGAGHYFIYIILGDG